MQSFPLPLGIGLVQVLSRIETPIPHVKEHLENSVHSVYPPFTDAIIENERRKALELEGLSGKKEIALFISIYSYYEIK